MIKKQIIIAVLTGVIFGQIFAEGDRPFTLINTIRVGYDDNVNRDANAKESSYIKDIVELSFRASLSERTDLMFKSRYTFSSDSEENNFLPNIYAVLSHSVSPRLLLQLTEFYKMGEKTTGNVSGDQEYFENTLTFSPTYVLTRKDRLSLSLSHMMREHDDLIEDEDVTTISGGISWDRELSPQRTRASLSLTQRMVEYDNRNSSYDATELVGEIGHTFNPEWHGTLGAGVTHVRPDFPDYMVSTNLVSADNSARLEPYFSGGLAYTPSPRTRFTANYSHSYKESNNSNFGGQTAQEVRLGAQHDFTAKIMGKLTARFLDTTYDDSDKESDVSRSDEERFDLVFYLHYKLNRVNFLELNLRHSEKSYSGAGSSRDWEQNMIDVGWRVEL
jgi:hypothetical protein